MAMTRYRQDPLSIPNPNVNIPASQQEAVDRRHALDEQQRDYRYAANRPGQGRTDPPHRSRRPPA